MKWEETSKEIIMSTESNGLQARRCSGNEGDRVDAVPKGRGHEGSPNNGMPATEQPSTSTLRGASSAAISRVNRFADYFVICGLDLDTGLEPDRFSGESRPDVWQPITYLFYYYKALDVLCVLGMVSWGLHLYSS